MSRIWKLYLVYTIVLIAGMSVAGFALQAQLKDHLEDHLAEDMITLARIMGNILPDTEDETLLDLFCKDHQRLTGVRVTVMRGDGRILADSSEEGISGDDRADRQEVVDAMKQGIGIAIRHSKTLDMDMLYVAFFAKEKKKILRLAVLMTQVRMFTNKVMIFFSLALYLAAVLAMIVAFLFTRYRINDRERPHAGGGVRTT